MDDKTLINAKKADALAAKCSEITGAKVEWVPLDAGHEIRIQFTRADGLRNSTRFMLGDGTPLTAIFAKATLNWEKWSERNSVQSAA